MSQRGRQPTLGSCHKADFGRVPVSASLNHGHRLAAVWMSCPLPAHPGECRDPVLVRVTLRGGPGNDATDRPVRPKDRVPAFAGMSGKGLTLVLDEAVRHPGSTRHCRLTVRALPVRTSAGRHEADLPVWSSLEQGARWRVRISDGV
jgi:hypothetical protein